MLNISILIRNETDPRVQIFIFCCWHRHRLLWLQILDNRELWYWVIMFELQHYQLWHQSPTNNGDIIIKWYITQRWQSQSEISAHHALLGGMMGTMGIEKCKNKSLSHINTSFHTNIRVQRGFVILEETISDWIFLIFPILVSSLISTFFEYSLHQEYSVSRNISTSICLHCNPPSLVVSSQLLDTPLILFSRGQHKHGYIQLSSSPSLFTHWSQLAINICSEELNSLVNISPQI